MIDDSATGIDTLKRRFMIIYVVSMVVLALVLFLLARKGIFGGKSSDDSAIAATPYDTQLLMQDGVLHAGMSRLQQMDAAFAMMLTDSSQSQQLDTINKMITAAESRFARAIDSIDNYNRKVAAGAEMVTRDITGAFREELSNRRVLANLRLALGMGKTVFSGDQQLMLQWQNELLTKQKKIESLETDLKSWQLNAFSNNQSAVGDLLKQDNETLQSAYKEQDRKITSLNTTLASMKVENERLKTQLADNKKIVDASDSPKEKSAAMEKRINELNAELKLTQVDCDISRADAQQIVSNARQRKALLTDALNTLNGLAKSDDAVLQLRVKEKVAKLKQLAATIRD